jgi:hypothetical protein
MSGALRTATAPWCAAGKDGSTEQHAQLVLVRCDRTTTNYDFKINPDGRLHVTDTNCLDGRPGGPGQVNAVIQPCVHRVGNLSHSTYRFEIKNGLVKPAGVDLCLTAPQVVAAGAPLSFKKCGGALRFQQGWAFGRVVS